DAGEGSGRVIEIEKPIDGRKCIAGERQYTESGGTDAGSENGRSTWPIGHCLTGCRLRARHSLILVHGYSPPGASPPTMWMAGPPRTGAYLLRKAPNAPATPVAAKATTTKAKTAVRRYRGRVSAGPYFAVT